MGTITRTVRYVLRGQRRVIITAHFPGAGCDGFRLTQRTEALMFGRWVELSSGAADRDIVARFCPELLDVHALHGCDGAGVPPHALSNGLYAAAGALGGLGRDHHAGREMPAEACFQHFATLMRIDVVKAHAVLNEIRAQYPAPYDAACSKAIESWIEAQRLRWAMEAGKCMSKHAAEAGLGMVAGEDDLELFE